jgi:hypothetical protein
MVVLGYWLFAPYKPIVFNNLPMKVANKVVKVGTPLIYTSDFCKYDTLIPLASKSFVDDIIYNTPAEVVVAKPKGCNVLTFQTLVPETLPPDDYVLKITYKYQVNPIRTVDVLVETEQFQVIK